MIDYSKSLRIKQGKDFKEYPDHLYQRKPRQRETYRANGKKSWTSSLESYDNIARKYCYCLCHNQRQPKHVVTINITQNHFIPDIPKLRKTFQAILQFLRRKKLIVALFMLEITKDGYKRNAADKVHFHCLIDTQLTKTALIEHLRDAMNVAKVRYKMGKHDYITDKNRDRVYRYVLKYNCWKKNKNGRRVKILPILFKQGLRVQKIYQVGDFWLDANGKHTNVDTIWEPMRLATKQKYASKESSLVGNTAEQSTPSIPPVVYAYERPFLNGIVCQHYEDGCFDLCGHYQDCGQYQECWLIPGILSFSQNRGLGDKL